MRSDLDHLPEAKQRELAHVVEIVREGFAEAISRRTQPRFRNGKPLKIILFGSYARGDWVEDPVGRYFSDFDLMVVGTHSRETLGTGSPVEDKILDFAARRNRDPRSLGPSDKRELLKSLQAEGEFERRGAVERIAAAIGLSRTNLYYYLSKSAGSRGPTAQA